MIRGDGRCGQLLRRADRYVSINGYRDATWGRMRVEKAALLLLHQAIILI